MREILGSMRYAAWWLSLRRHYVKSSLSFHNGNCLEVSGLDDGSEYVYVRNSRHPRAGVMRLPAAEWDLFIETVRHDVFARRPAPPAGPACTPAA